MIALQFLALAALAAVHDFLALAWHYAREARRTRRMILIGIVMEIVGAVPLVVALELGAWWPVAAGVVGSAVGTSIGMGRRAPPAR